MRSVMFVVSLLEIVLGPGCAGMGPTATVWPTGVWGDSTSSGSNAGGDHKATVLWSRSAPVCVTMGAGFEPDESAECASVVRGHAACWESGYDSVLQVEIIRSGAVIDYRARYNGEPAGTETRTGSTVGRLCRGAVLFGLRSALIKSGVQPAVAVKMDGPATEEQQDRCGAALTDGRIFKIENPKVLARVTILRPASGGSGGDPGGNYLQVRLSEVDGSGILVEGGRPDWGVDALCQDAAIQALRGQLQQTMSRQLPNALGTP